jgi:hypothetical protein
MQARLDGLVGGDPDAFGSWGTVLGSASNGAWAIESGGGLLCHVFVFEVLYVNISIFTDICQVSFTRRRADDAARRRMRRLLWRHVGEQRLHTPVGPVALFWG